MLEYTYHNNLLRVKSDALIAGLSEAVITRETTETITMTTYSVGRLIKREESGGCYYAWFEAKPQTVGVDNSPGLYRQIDAVWDDMAAAYSEGVQQA